MASTIQQRLQAEYDAAKAADEAAYAEYDNTPRNAPGRLGAAIRADAAARRRAAAAAALDKRIRLERRADKPAHKPAPSYAFGARERGA